MAATKTRGARKREPLRGRARYERAARIRLRSLKAAAAVGAATRDPNLTRRCWELQRLAQRSFGGWATHHRTRWWEYPWVVDRVERHLAGRTLTAADFGAGRSPIPIALAGLGLATTVVDPDSAKQMNKRGGGEWAWTNYRRWNVKTLATGVEDATVFAPSSLGVAVSVSVIEHLPAEVRRVGLRNIADFLEPGGIAVFTLDLARDTNLLWNRILGHEVEPFDTHGDLDTFVAECKAVGLEVVESTPSPLRDDRVDVHGFVLRRT